MHGAIEGVSSVLSQLAMLEVWAVLFNGFAHIYIKYLLVNDRLFVNWPLITNEWAIQPHES